MLDFLTQKEILFGFFMLALLVALALFLYSRGMELFTGFDSFLSDAGLLKEGESETAPMYVSGVSSSDDQVQEVKQSEPSEEPKQLSVQDLLPADDDLMGKNFLFSDFQHGIDSRGSTVKNLQLRSDPIVPKMKDLTPFNQPVLDSQDTLRKPLEIGE